LAPKEAINYVAVHILKKIRAVTLEIIIKEKP